MVRTGGHVYGIPSFDGTSAQEMGVIPVMTVVSKVEQVNKAETGEFEITVGAGFTHGIPGLAKGKTEVAIAGNRYSISGVFAETMTVSGLLEVEVGADVFIFGDGTHGEQTVREWGDAIGTLGDEICCRISPALKRTLVV
jgi:alanine racemase